MQTCKVTGPMFEYNSVIIMKKSPVRNTLATLATLWLHRSNV
jgi:hypothetical protein